MAALRSLQATPEGINEIQRALTHKKLGRGQLAGLADKAAKSTANNFCTGKPVSRKNFVLFCELLDLNWEIISGNAAEAKPNPSPPAPIDIDALVQDLRDRGRADIQKDCGTMRVLDMTQKIDANTIYTDVNILEKVSGKSRAEIHQLMQDCGPENFDRFFLGNVRHERVNGLEAIARHNLLMILGRPGSGKTTFLKRLAMWCIAGEQFADRVPVFVTLKEFADNERKPRLLDFIGNAGEMQQVLNAGRALVLLDGLDEVQAAEHDRVLAEIRNFARNYDQNTLIITCRIAAREYIFEQFTEVEVADFNQEQIADFVKKWFQLKYPKQAVLFLERLKTSEPIRELATNPLLLTLLCLEFEEASDFPASRAELYQRGLNVLLTKWDGQRGIKRDVVYQKLSTKRKESLLAELAFYTFERGDYFFKQAVAERLISQYIQDLPDARTDPEALLVDSHAVLKSIENQHGLLTERATEIYSFSHLTFHEYFAAKHLTERPEREAAIHQLLSHSAQTHWREIILLVTEQLEPADALLQGLKAEADKILKDNSTLQAYLRWVQVKSSSVCGELNFWEVRNFYFDLAFDLAHDRDLALDRDLATEYDLAHNLALDSAPDLNLALAFDFGFALALARAFDFDRAFAHDLKSINSLAFQLAQDLQHVFARFLTFNPEFKEQLEQLYNTLQHKLEEKNPDLQVWRKSHGKEWVENLRQLAIKYRNIGHNRQFTDEQSLKLEQYHKVNKLLIDCLKSECRISRSVREEIEETLFLPLEAIEQWKQNRRSS
jgi:predicted NACHT family NTPase